MTEPGLTHLYKTLTGIFSLFIGDFILDESINLALAELGSLTSASRTYLYRFHHKAKLLHITHEWLDEDTGPFKGSATSISGKEYSWFIALLHSEESILIKDIADIHASGRNEKKIFEQQGIKSLIAFPLKIKGKLYGFIGLDYIRNKCIWQEKHLKLLKLAADIISSSIERKLSEKSLRKSEKLYENIFENTGAATIIIRADNSIQMINSEFERLFGYKREEVEDKMRLVDLVEKEDQPILQQYHFLMMSNPAAVPENYEFRYITRDGQPRNAYVTGSALLDAKSCMISFIDITEFKEVENQLRIAKEKAEESDRLKSAFLANVSHEIRTPLNAITGFAALLSNPNLHLDKKEKYIKQILTGSNELVGLIDNVLDISRIESGTLKPRISDFLLNLHLEEIREFYDDFKIQQAKEHLSIILTLPKNSEKLVVKTDKIRLQQILANLIENAIKFTSSGNIEFGYSITSEQGNDNDKQSLMFFVKDTGIGIFKKDREKIFGRFVKLEDREDHLYRGAGLGLALARDLCHLLEGEMWVESIVGQGSTFYFTLPFSAAVRVRSDKKISKPGDKQDRSDRTIMIAEDTESNYLYIQEILSSTQAKLIRAKNGKEAVDLFSRNSGKIDMIFMDILMPGYDGFEATKLIRKIRRDIPVVALTAFTFEGEFSEGLYAGCFNDYIMKPFDIKVIHKMLDKYLHPG